MKCVVTGGAGYIGTCLVMKLLDRGHDVAVLDLRKPAADVEWLRADIRDPDSLRFKGYDAVFHLAALADARRSADDPRFCHETNVLGTLNVVRAMRRDGVGRILLASSAWVAAAQAGDAVEEHGLFDLGSINTTYGASKLIQEIVCYSHRAETGGPDCTIFRYGTSYGEGMWNGLVVRAFMASAESRGVVTVMGDGTQYREFLYLGDMCDAQILALGEVARNKVYNLVGDRPITVEELAREVVKHFPAKIEHVPQQRPEPPPKRILNDLAKRELGWTPRTTLADGIAKCAAWWRSLSPAGKQAPYWI
ncbi:MAG: NAD-dependent epimerase/dehydratase family protein [Verrucomicrobia bacterium]|nr:NAD-dependent epimerase/dehydratase family protein [Verrucomicrobiota bacterium]